MNYLRYSPEDFALNESFQQWVIHQDEEAAHFWSSFLKEHPEKANDIAEAQQLARLIQFRQYTPGSEVFQRISHHIHHELTHAGNLRKTRQLHAWLRIAAMLAGFLVLSTITVYLLRNQPITHSTVYGETQTLLLPDGSTVMLNANTKLSYQRGWDTHQPREVWLEGEAYFEVKRQAQSQAPVVNNAYHPFIVHANGTDVVVLGTSFNINNRRDKTQVVLSSGKVKVQCSQRHADEAIYMEPGEMVEVSGPEQKMTQKMVNPEVYTSWRNDIYIFENTPLRQIASMMEDFYGWKVIIEDKNIGDLTFTAKVPMMHMDDLLTLLAETFHLEIKKENHKIIINKKS